MVDLSRRIGPGGVGRRDPQLDDEAALVDALRRVDAPVHDDAIAVVVGRARERAAHEEIAEHLLELPPHEAAQTVVVRTEHQGRALPRGQTPQQDEQPAHVQLAQLAAWVERERVHRREAGRLLPNRVHPPVEQPRHRVAHLGIERDDAGERLVRRREPGARAERPGGDAPGHRTVRRDGPRGQVGAPRRLPHDDPGMDERSVAEHARVLGGEGVRQPSRVSERAIVEEVPRQPQHHVQVAARGAQANRRRLHVEQ